MSEVYKAHDGGLNRTVAIKRLIYEQADAIRKTSSQGPCCTTFVEAAIPNDDGVPKPYAVLACLGATRCRVSTDF